MPARRGPAASWRVAIRWLGTNFSESRRGRSENVRSNAAHEGPACDRPGRRGAASRGSTIACVNPISNHPLRWALCRQQSRQACRRRGGAPAKGRNIPPTRKIDDNSVLGTRGGVVALQGTPDSDGVNPHDCVGLRIEVRPAAESVNRNRIGLDTVASADKRGLDDECQKGRQHGRMRESGTHENVFERGADFARAGRRSLLSRRVKLTKDQVLSLNCRNCACTPW